MEIKSIAAEGMQPDVIFKVKETIRSRVIWRQISCHRSKLIDVSQVFDAWLNGEWADTKVIQLIDFTYRDFHAFIHFIYNGSIPKENTSKLEDLINLYQVADMYQVQALKDEIRNQILSKKRTAKSYRDLKDAIEALDGLALNDLRNALADALGRRLNSSNWLDLARFAYDKKLPTLTAIVLHHLVDERKQLLRYFGSMDPDFAAYLFKELLADWEARDDLFGDLYSHLSHISSCNAHHLRQIKRQSNQTADHVITQEWKEN